MIRVEDHMGLVYRFAMRYARRTSLLSQDDLVQEGALGLMMAIERFDPSLGFQFSTYAIWWVKAFMLRALDNHRSLVRLPVHVQEDLRNGKCRRDDLPLKAVSLTAIATTPDPAPPPDEAFIRSEILKRLGFTRLPLRMQGILERRFGLDGGSPETLEDVSKYWGISRERIRQLETQALEQLRLNYTRSINGQLQVPSDRPPVARRYSPRTTDLTAREVNAQRTEADRDFH